MEQSLESAMPRPEERAQLETVAGGLREVRRESPELAQQETPSRPPTKEEQIQQYVASLPPETLEREQNRLADFIQYFDASNPDLDELDEFASSSAEEIAKEILRDEIALLEAIRMQRGVLGDYAFPKGAPRVPTEYAPTLPPSAGRETVPPPKRRPKAKA